MRIKVYGGPLDGEKFRFVGHVLYVQKLPHYVPTVDCIVAAVSFDAGITDEPVRAKAWVYKLFSDPVRGPAYIFMGDE